MWFILCNASEDTHRQFPRETLDSHDLSVGEWIPYNAYLDGVELQTVSFQDLKENNLPPLAPPSYLITQRKQSIMGLKAVQKLLSYTSLMLHQLKENKVSWGYALSKSF